MKDAQMDKRYGRLITLIVAAIFALPVIIILLINNLKKQNSEPIRYDFELETIEYLNEHLESFEQMCEYDLEHYHEYEHGETWPDENLYLVPIKGEPFQEERYAIFNQLGADDGFRYGCIYPDYSKVEFLDTYGNIEITLIYYKDGNNEQPSFYRIGDHFALICYEPHRP